MPDDISAHQVDSRLHFARILVIEDDHRLANTLATLLGYYADDVRTSGSLQEALQLFSKWQPDVLLLDFRLPDGHANELLRQISRRTPFPAVIALSAYAQPEETFEMARLGVRTYLQKPVNLEDIEAALQEVRFGEPDITPHIRSSVGSVGLKQMETQVRQVMLEEALGRTGGSRRGAARLLQVSRQFVQHVLNKFRG